MVSVPPSGIASRALTARLSDHLLDLAGVGHDAAERGVELEPERDRARRRARRSMLPMLVHDRVEVDEPRLQHLLAAEREQLARQRRGRACAAPADLLRRRSRRGSAVRGLAAAARRSPGSTVSRLLKSWAMPPASRPTASIFCAWRSCASRSSARSRPGGRPGGTAAAVGVLHRRGIEVHPIGPAARASQRASRSTCGCRPAAAAQRSLPLHATSSGCSRTPIAVPRVALLQLEQRARAWGAP